MPIQYKHSKPPLHPFFGASLPAALEAVRHGSAGNIAFDPRGGLVLGRLGLRPSDDRVLRADLADAARLGGVGEVRLPDGSVAIPDLDGVFGRALPYPDRQGDARALALARATLLLGFGAAALARAEMRRRTALAKRVANAVRAASPLAGPTLRTLAGQLELACHLHELLPGRTSPVPGLLVDRRALGEVAEGNFDRLALRALARREAAGVLPASTGARATRASIDCSSGSIRRARRMPAGCAHEPRAIAPGADRRSRSRAAVEPSSFSVLLRHPFGSRFSRIGKAGAQHLRVCRRCSLRKLRTDARSRHRTAKYKRRRRHWAR